ncbi:2Fe-2S iron-sulfur cluster-binding protein [Aquabacterium sp. OR-4]|uniref:2Fe-2S iron-sulfur cluster-binding protein n=1 Tax=Aquabacterium sp. OR-4 TaxID=2978127 RepID=UPI0021B29E4B|nr:2Fe-2S iron-sulfur cluster-binding protein [Aquabacterium sp. OR-4]MDT7837028.1 2Fe-2S iron-sulfur cluster-binding protein [Aquabacterium sp. OR-4]
MQKFDVLIEDTGEHFACADARSLLEGMVALNRKGIPVGCRNGGCGVCKVAILQGEVATRVMSRAHVSEDDERHGRLLACRVAPRSDIRLAVLGPMRKSVCRNSAAPTNGAGAEHCTERSPGH